MVYPNETLPEETGNYTDATENIGFTKSNNSTTAPIGITTTNNGTPVMYMAGAVVVGAMGLIANAAVFTLFCFKRKSERNVCNALIQSQTVIDFSASTFLIITYVVKLFGVYLTGSLGRLYCKLFDSNAMYTLGINASTAGLVVISIERYTKIVHSILYRIRFRSWMKYAGLVIPWIYAVLASFPVLMATSDINNGRCMSPSSWSAEWQRVAYVCGTVIVKFLLPLSVFFFCYTRILLLIREQSKVRTLSSSSANNGQNPLSRSEKNTVKIMLFVIACFVVSYAPFYFYLLPAFIQMPCCPSNSSFYYVSVWISYLNIVINPFIYSANSEIVKSVIRKIGRRLHRKELTSTSAWTSHTIDT